MSEAELIDGKIIKKNPVSERELYKIGIDSFGIRREFPATLKGEAEMEKERNAYYDRIKK